MFSKHIESKIMKLISYSEKLDCQFNLPRSDLVTLVENHSINSYFKNKLGNSTLLEVVGLLKAEYDLDSEEAMNLIQVYSFFARHSINF